MELEFDKEIDAILRKAQTARGVLVGDDPPEPKKHLDADTIAAFAENALPAGARSLYVEHLADCGRCRKLLSESIVMSRGADAAAASTVLAAAETAVPWYSKIFRTPSLAIAMGSLVVIFSGVLGFVLLERQSENAANNAIVSRGAQPEVAEAPYYGGESSTTTNTNAAPAMSPGVNPAAQPNIMQPGVVGSGPSAAANEPTGDAGKASVAEEKELDDKKSALDGATGGAESAPKPQPPAAAAPPPVDQPKTEARKLATGEDELTASGRNLKDLAQSETRDSRSRMDREGVQDTMKKAGPMRGAGPLNNQQQTNNSGFEMSVTRKVGGKTFNNRNGAWYDTAYHQQQTTNISRGSDDFKKLDSGLRLIVNELYGVVVVVWKGKAYRIN